MKDAIKIISAIFLLIGFLALSYKAGQNFQPISTFENKYETVISFSENNLEALNIEGIETNSFSYIPAYSHIYYSKGVPIEMAVTLSLRNIDMKNSLIIEKIFFHNTNGKLIRKYVTKSFRIPPLGTKEFFIDKTDIEGGSGANFIVLFKSEQKILPPIFESIMIGEHYGKPYIFSSRGTIH